MNVMNVNVAPEKARVLLVDDHALLRTGVANIINQEPDLRVIAEAGDGVQAIEAYERHRPDVTLLDLRMPVMEGVEVVRRIRDRDPQARLIILTTYDTDDEISRALKAGAKAYVLKDISADGLVNCIRDVLAGKTYLAPAAAAKLAEGVTRVQLTPREIATLKLVADGKANKEIATALDISERTVKTHLAHLFEKLGATSRTEAVKVATRRGLVRLDYTRFQVPRFQVQGSGSRFARRNREPAPGTWNPGTWNLRIVRRVVSHAAGFPLLSPRLNHSTRCAELPCVKRSGMTRPVAIFCSRSSPIAAAAFSPSSTSPGSSSTCPLAARPGCAAA